VGFGSMKGDRGKKTKKATYFQRGSGAFGGSGSLELRSMRGKKNPRRKDPGGRVGNSCVDRFIPPWPGLVQ